MLPTDCCTLLTVASYRFTVPIHSTDSPDVQVTAGLDWRRGDTIVALLVRDDDGTARVTYTLRGRHIHACLNASPACSLCFGVGLPGKGHSVTLLAGAVGDISAPVGAFAAGRGDTDFDPAGEATARMEVLVEEVRRHETLALRLTDGDRETADGSHAALDDECLNEDMRCQQHTAEEVVLLAGLRAELAATGKRVDNLHALKRAVAMVLPSDSAVLAALDIRSLEVCLTTANARDVTARHVNARDVHARDVSRGQPHKQLVSWRVTSSPRHVTAWRFCVWHVTPPFLDTSVT